VDAPASHPSWPPARYRLVGAALVVGLYVLSLFLPVLADLKDFNGAEAFVAVLRTVIGLDVPREGYWIPMFLGFLANPYLAIGVVLLALGWPREAAGFGFLALGLGLIWPFLLTERGIPDPTLLGAGYYCWLGSMILLTGCGLTLHLLTRGLDHGAPATPEPVGTAEGRP
jgi:hypothetical protein